MRKSFLKRQPIVTEMSLQITSMADIFVIILVFLLKSYGTSALDIQPTKGMSLPVADADGTPLQALRIEISEKAILVESNPVASIENFAFKKEDILPNGASKVLSGALDHERKREMLIAKNNADVKVDPRIVIVADERVPYSSIKTILSSAAINGYTDFKLAVIKKE